MSRCLVAVLASVLLCAAGPRKPPAVPLPVPPPLPAHPPSDQPAPLPNAGLRSPNVVVSERTEFGLHIFRMKDFEGNDSVVPGSVYQSPEQRRPMQPPGFIVTVPLQ